MKPAPRARDLMDESPVKLVEGTRLREAAHIMQKRRLPSVPVMTKEGKLLGFFSLQSLFKALADAVHHLAPRGTVECYLTADPPVVDESASLMRIVMTFLEVGHEHAALPVMRGEQLMGTIQRYDVIHAMYDFTSGADDPEKRILYLSALREQDESPFVP